MPWRQPTGHELDTERAQFGALQTHFASLWKSVLEDPAAPHSAVIVPSLSMDQDELAKIEGVSFYEERLLFGLIRLRHPTARVMYVTSQPVHPEIVDYYLQLLVGVPASHARRRLEMQCVYDASPQALTEKILARPRLLEKMRRWIGDPRRAYITCFNSSPLERSLAVSLGVPLNGVDPDLLELGSKSGSRRNFRAAGVRMPEGFEGVGSAEEAARRLHELSSLRPGIRRAVVKLNVSFSGEGNAVFRYPSSAADQQALGTGDLEPLRRGLEWATPTETFERFTGKLTEVGGIVEEFVEAEEVHSPSVQMRISPTGGTDLISTHEQILGGRTGQSYLGCRFPARQAYRGELQEAGQRVGEVLRKQGVISRFGVDFMAARDPGGPWQVSAIEINLRMGGTTFPFVALEFLTGGKLDPESGLFHARNGAAKYYVATDHLKSTQYRGLLPEDLMDVTIGSGLYYNPQTATGVLFHMIGALSQFGRLGVVAIGDSPEEADELFARTSQLLNEVTSAATPEAGRPETGRVIGME